MTLGLRDIPLEKDEDEALGFCHYAEALSEFILECETPLTIALQGDWGSGKTSLMNLIVENLEKKPLKPKTV
jgi:tRNA A37 threonylcarbamoyladenosine biosynthesis protein TsaE